MKIQKPSLGRVVIYTAWRGAGEQSGKVDEYAGTVVKVHMPEALVGVPTSDPAFDQPGDLVDIVTLGSSSVYHNNKVRHDAGGAAGTWRYPPHVKDEIEVAA